jgi:predicted lipid carrier protein YhbT
MHFVQRKDIKLEWVSAVVDRRISVVQERQFEAHVVSQEGVDGDVGAY